MLISAPQEACWSIITNSYVTKAVQTIFSSTSHAHYSSPHEFIQNELQSFFRICIRPFVGTRSKYGINSSRITHKSQTSTTHRKKLVIIETIHCAINPVIMGRKSHRRSLCISYSLSGWKKPQTATLLFKPPLLIYKSGNKSFMEQQNGTVCICLLQLYSYLQSGGLACFHLPG